MEKAQRGETRSGANQSVRSFFCIRVAAGLIIANQHQQCIPGVKISTGT